jgi:hypothetical protein
MIPISPRGIAETREATEVSAAADSSGRLFGRRPAVVAKTRLPILWALAKPVRPETRP